MTAIIRGLGRTVEEFDMTQRTCTIDGCDKRIHSRGMCGMHVQRWKRGGDPLVTSRIVGDDEARFWSYITKEPDTGCWIWSGTISADGYGVINVGRKRRYTHTWYYETHVGPIGDGLEPDHLCRTRLCANPDHLELVTHRENILRGDSPQAINARKTHCPQGHAYSPENTKIQPRGGRLCRICQAEHSRKRAVRRRAAYRSQK